MIKHYEIQDCHGNPISIDTIDNFAYVWSDVTTGRRVCQIQFKAVDAVIPETAFGGMVLYHLTRYSSSDSEVGHYQYMMVDADDKLVNEVLNEYIRRGTLAPMMYGPRPLDVPIINSEFVRDLWDSFPRMTRRTRNKTLSKMYSQGRDNFESLSPDFKKIFPWYDGALYDSISRYSSFEVN